MQDSNSNGGRRLIPDPEVWKSFGVSPVTGWRWQNDPTLDFPTKIKIRTRNYRDHDQLEAWKARRVRGEI